MRLIDADEIVYESIDSCDTSRHESYYGTGIVAVRKEDIDSLPTIKPEQRWIPCSERLPEEDGCHCQKDTEVDRMNDYISRKSVIVGLDYIINELNKLITDDSSNDGYTDIKNQVEEIKRGVLKLPLEDVQPVVRCKNCKHYKTTGNFKTYCDEENFPDEGQKELPEWWFCAGGKRKGSDG